MNEAISEKPIKQNAAECCAKVNQYVRKNPAAVIVGALGAGIVLGLLVRSMRTEPSQGRLAQILEDLECRLHETAVPALHKAQAIVRRNSNALGKGLRESESRIEHSLRSVSERLHNMFS